MTESLGDVLAYLEATPVWVTRRVEGLSEAALRWKPPEESFSILENVCHLRDIEREAFGPRLRRLLDEENPWLHDVDGARLARERDYQREDAAPALAAFAAARRENLSVLRGAGRSELERRGTLEGYGSLSLGELGSLMRRHDEEHRAALDALHPAGRVARREPPSMGRATP